MHGAPEIRLRIVEALTRGHSVLAVNNVPAFLDIVSKIETFVIDGNLAEGATGARTRKTDKAA